jgi:hypothetical protein
MIKTHRIPSIAWDTMIWKTETFVSPWRPDSIKHCSSTFEHRSDISVVVAGFPRKAMVEEPKIAEEDRHNTQVSTKSEEVSYKTMFIDIPNEDE